MTRRRFAELLAAACSLFIAGAVGIPALVAGLSPALRARRGESWQPIGRVDGFPTGAVRQAIIKVNRTAWPRSFGPEAVFVWRSSESDLVVFSRSCTDLGCPLNYDPRSACFFCPCHGGIFSQDGKRLAGPPKGPMYRYAHRVRNEVLEIDTSSIPPAA